MNKQYHVYMMTNKSNSVLYSGITNNLVRRAYEHNQKHVDGFTKRYNAEKLIYFETFDDPENAIQREKAIKNPVRRKKNELVQSFNPAWKDLYQEILSP